MNCSAFAKKLHTEKSVIIQQYQPLYPGVYNITVDQSCLDNVAKVIYQDGRQLLLNGNHHNVVFQNLTQSEMFSAVRNILGTIEAKRQEVLWSRLNLDDFSRIYPIEGSRTPYFNLYQNDYGAFTYSPLADERFAFLIPDSFGLFCNKSGNRFFGAYGNDLESTLLDTCHVDEPKLLSLLCEYEPSAVWQYEEPRLIDRLNRMIQETNARPFVFNQPDGTTLVSLPEEVHDYLSPGECHLSEKMLVLQENTNNDPTPSDQSISQPEEDMSTDAFIPQMSI